MLDCAGTDNWCSHDGVVQQPRQGDMRRLLAWGVDAIVTDRPDVAVPIVRKWAGQ